MTEETQPVTTQTQPVKPDLIKVDVYGEEILLPVDQAKSIIAKRDQRHSVFKDLDTKVKEYETKLTETTRTAAAQKAALEGKLAEAESLFSQKANEKLEKINNRIVLKEIESALLADESFIKESKDDALKLLKSDYKFKLDEEGEKVITDDGRNATDVVKEWLKSKSIFKKATTIMPTGGKVGPKSTVQKTANSQPQINFTDALYDHLNKNKK
jgi:hypothetical protein